jgi:hypothetical protein
MKTIRQVSSITNNECEDEYTVRKFVYEDKEKNIRTEFQYSDKDDSFRFDGIIKTKAVSEAIEVISRIDIYTDERNFITIIIVPVDTEVIGVLHCEFFELTELQDRELRELYMQKLITAEEILEAKKWFEEKEDERN